MNQYYIIIKGYDHNKNTVATTITRYQHIHTISVYNAHFEQQQQQQQYQHYFDNNSTIYITHDLYKNEYLAHYAQITLLADAVDYSHNLVTAALCREFIMHTLKQFSNL